MGMGLMPEVPEATAQAKQDVSRALNVLNNHLLHHTFMVGNQITLADICIACALHDGMKHVLDEKFRAPLGNLMRWHSLVTRQPEFIAVLGEAKFCGGSGKDSKAGSAPPAKAADAGGKKEKPAKEDKKAEAKKESKKEKGGATPKAKAEAKAKAEGKKDPSAADAAAAEADAKKKKEKKKKKKKKKN